jgi:hypothetical protein
MDLLLHRAPQPWWPGSSPSSSGPSRRSSWQVAEACLDQLQPLSGFRTSESGTYGGEGGRMIAAISIGIIIIIAVIIAALAIIYFILKGSPR